MVNKVNVQRLIDRLELAKVNGEEYDQNNYRKCSMYYSKTIGLGETENELSYQSLYDLDEQQFDKIFWLEKYTRSDLYTGLEPSRTIDEQIKNLKDLLV